MKDKKIFKKGMDTLRRGEKMERAIRSVLYSWKKRLASDPAHDIEDLAQELRISYWKHESEEGNAPMYYTIRSWAWNIMRSWGYKGSRSSKTRLLSSERIAREISFSRNKATRDYDVTDEEMLDSIHHFPGAKRKWKD